MMSAPTRSTLAKSGEEAMNDFARKTVNNRWGTSSTDAVAMSNTGRTVMVTKPAPFTLNEPPVKPTKPKESYCNPGSRDARWEAHLRKNAGKKPQHKLYQSSSRTIGHKLTERDLQHAGKNVRVSQFSEWVARGHMRSKVTSLNTGLYKSRYHKKLDGLI